MMENHSINNTYGISVPPNSWNSSSRTCLGNCTYYDSLANSNGLAEEYTANGITGCSLGCYIAITSGYANTLQPCNNGPSGSGCLLQIPNIVDRLESANLSWKAYMEDYPITSGCFNDFMGNYEPNHNPFIYYADIQNNPTRCSRIVTANSPVLVQNSTCWPTAVQTDNLFLNSLNSPSTVSNYTFLTPNRIDDNHDCNDVSIGNAWLNSIIPQILGSTLFRTKRAALFVTFDEQGCTNSFPPCPSPSVPELYSVWASNPTNHTTKSGFKSVKSYTHFNPLKTIEDNWKLQPLVPSTDGSAAPMQEFFG
jgi:hypothetical protein